MSQVQSNEAGTSATLLPPPQVGGFRHRFASLVSAIIHPLVFPLVTVVVLSYAYTHSVSDTLLYTVVALALTALPVALLVFIQVRRGKWTDLDVSVRKQRYALYPVSLAFLGVLAYVYYRLQAPREAVVSVLTLVGANIVNGIVNLAWKISAHATTAAACASLLWQLSPGHTWGPPAAAGAVLVGWSRVELRRHTAGQVLAGWLVGVGSSVLAVRLGM
ncbi:MAG: phosphatase PAP2 family protein [Ktedonobacterales bacterium]|nr:phosphatase PAP2 family protein [Ktedonobacterales bacterium]